MKKLILCASISSLLFGCGGGSSETANSIADETALEISAGDDVSVEERSFVELEGAVFESTGAVTINWSQVSGTMVDIDDANSLRPNFRAPSTSSNEDIVIRMTVSDGDTTITDDITVKVNDRTGSSQGIDEDSDRRRIDAETGRSSERRMSDSREVRSYDGSNNNLENELWGAGFTHLARLGDEDYGDGISSMAGQSRPSARVVSNNIVAQEDDESFPNSFGTSDFLWQWGQFIDHDIGITDGTEEEEDIIVPTGDVYFDPNSTGEATILFARALYDPDTGTDTSNPREQENEISAWIDGSMVYGSDDERAAALRVSEDSPYLATSEGNLLPFNTSGQTNANAFGVDDDALFLAGEVRVNEQVGLTAMHTLWVREHNRIAAILASESPDADGETIFQAARRLVIAKIQIITYDEYLPALIGEDALSNYQGYDDDVNPGLYNEFSVGAYRYGHSLVNSTLLRLDAEGNTISDGNLALRDAFFTAPNLLTSETDLDPIFRGMASQLSQTLDTKIINDLRNFLFGRPGAGGLDLASLNIQRGRDHGIPSYNDMREVMDLDRVEDFDEITSDTALQAALEATYDSVDDIDLWVGGLAEDALSEEGSQLGQLFREMHIYQFEAFRDGDRFWYQRDLTNDELERVEDTTLAEVIRANTDIANEIQDNVFFVSE